MPSYEYICILVFAGDCTNLPICSYIYKNIKLSQWLICHVPTQLTIHQKLFNQQLLKKWWKRYFCQNLHLKWWFHWPWKGVCVFIKAPLLIKLYPQPAAAFVQMSRLISGEGYAYPTHKNCSISMLLWAWKSRWQHESGRTTVSCSSKITSLHMRTNLLFKVTLHDSFQ